MKKIATALDVNEVLGAEYAIIFKHSPTCGISAAAHRQVQFFLEAHPEAPVYIVNVISERPLSQDIARRTGVQHASPQILVTRDGVVDWDASHLSITVDSLEAKALVAISS